MIIVSFIFFCLSFGQVSHYESSSLKTSFNNSLFISNSMVGETLDINLNAYSSSRVIDNKKYIEFPIELEDSKTIKLKLFYNNLPDGSKFFLIDLDDDDIIGPFYVSGNYLELGAINSSNFIIQCIIPDIDNAQSPDFMIKEISDLSKTLIYEKKKYYPISNESRENPVIVVTGFWPPTNEMIRHFSQDINLNPNGWQGEDWQGSGYDIISFFPEFDVPDCDNCGQGFGDFEVDYQDTSNDFWSIIGEINPVTIITFSRGYIDESWELEFNYYNRTNWYNDYLNPFLPTPNPPDSDAPVGFLRNSNLPMQEIMDNIT